MITDSIRQEVKIGDIVSVNDSNNRRYQAEIISFANGKFGMKNLPVFHEILGQQPHPYHGWFVKIALQDKTQFDKNFNIIRHE